MKVRVWDPFMMARKWPQIWEEEFASEWDDTQMDMYEENDKFVIKVKAPGFDEKNVDISIEENSVTITGKSESQEEEKDEKRKYYRKEITTRSFTRSVTLPRKVDAEKAEAEFKNGILEIRLPKAEEAKPKKIAIKVKSK